MRLTADEEAWMDEAGRDWRDQQADGDRPRWTMHRRLPAYCHCCCCLQRYCICSCCCGKKR